MKHEDSVQVNSEKNNEHELKDENINDHILQGQINVNPSHSYEKGKTD